MQFYGTLGPACDSEQAISDLFSAGMTGIRLNLSHQSLRDCAQTLALFHKTAPSGAALLADLQGPELRMQNTVPIVLAQGETVELGQMQLPVPTMLLSALKPGMEMHLDDGAITLSVLEGARCHVIHGGTLAPRKSIDVPGLTLQMPTLTASDLDNIACCVEYGVTGVMLPFVREAQDLKTLRQALDAAGASHVRIFAKIENPDGVKKLPEFLSYADEIVIARGDLGNNMPIWELPRVQKQISAVCRKADKPFMVVTQMLHSMIAHPVPTRAEVSDIFNAVLDGASSLMLTGETAMGKYPVEAMRILCKTAKEAVCSMHK